MFDNKFPSLPEAQKIWEDGIARRIADYGMPKRLEKEYRFHTTQVAEICRVISTYISGMDSEKAYILGLLHDYGKRINEREAKYFHGLEGYYALMKMGYSEAARINLTHTFPVQNFDLEYYPNYSEKDLLEVKGLLAHIIYDDYDRLVQFADKLCEGMNIVSFEKRIKCIAARYNLSQKHIDYLREESKMLKDYFDNICCTDTFKLLNIEDN